MRRQSIEIIDKHENHLEFHHKITIVERPSFRQGKTFVENRKKQLKKMNHFSGICKQLPGIRLTAGELTEDEFQQLRDYLMETAYGSNEVYNVSASLLKFFFSLFVRVFSCF